jgi:diacylglycerol kinase (ATP)
LKEVRVICCTLIAALLALMAWPVRRLAVGRASPLAWRPHAAGETVATAGFSLTARGRSVGFAVEGVRDLFRYEHNAWVHLGAAVLVLLAGLMLRVPLADWRWLILAIALVWAAEAGNTAVEQLCDLVHPGRHPVVKRIKDLAAGAVLICAAAAALIGAATLLPHLHALVRMPNAICSGDAR